MINFFIIHFLVPDLGAANNVLLNVAFRAWSVKKVLLNVGILTDFMGEIEAVF